MLAQTVAQLMPLLQLLNQPAFCLCADGTVTGNQAALHLMPVSGESLPQWLGDSAQLYDCWDRQTDLQLPLTLSNLTFTVTVQPMEDGTLFLLSGTQREDVGFIGLSVAAQVMRQPLSELSVVSKHLFDTLDELENPELQRQTASLNQHIYRLIRLSGNLADLERLRSGQYTLQRSLIDLRTFFLQQEKELVPLCRYAGRDLELTPPKTTLQISADSDLLERLILNLLSNAIKFGTAEAPITMWAEATKTAVLIRVRNHCSQSNSELLRSAYNRMEQRGMLPDPKWGIGLGLPIVRYIAMLHGGTAALEVSTNGMITVTASLSRRRPDKDLTVKSPLRWDNTGGMRRSLVELSDVLPSTVYHNEDL